MAKRGRKVVFHGAFGTKVRAKRKERVRSGSWIKRVSIQGDTRYLVLTEK